MGAAPLASIPTSQAKRRIHFGTAGGERRGESPRTRHTRDCFSLSPPRPRPREVGVAGFWRIVGAIGVRRLLLVPSLLSATLAHMDASVVPPSLRLVIMMGEAPQRNLCESVVAALPKVGRRSSVVERSRRGGAYSSFDIAVPPA